MCLFEVFVLLSELCSLFGELPFGQGELLFYQGVELFQLCNFLLLATFTISFFQFGELQLVLYAQQLLLFEVQDGPLFNAALLEVALLLLSNASKPFFEKLLRFDYLRTLSLEACDPLLHCSDFILVFTPKVFQLTLQILDPLIQSSRQDR